VTNWLETPVIDQRNPRWQSAKLGRSDSTIGAYGCLVSCFSMLAHTDPLDMNARMISLGGYQTGSCPACAATFDVQKFAPRAPAIVDVTMSYPYAPFPAAQCSRLMAHLKGGNPAVLEVDINPNNRTHDMHFVLAVSAFGNEVANSNIVIHDPWFSDETTLCPRYGSTLARAIVRAIYYGGPSS